MQGEQILDQSLLDSSHLRDSFCQYQDFSACLKAMSTTAMIMVIRS